MTSQIAASGLPIPLPVVVPTPVPVSLPPPPPIPPRYVGLPNAATFGRLASRPDAVDPTAVQYFADWLSGGLVVDPTGAFALRPDLVPLGSRPRPVVLSVTRSRPTIVILAGDGQSGKPRTALPVALRVKITDGGKPVVGAPVGFEVRTFGATIGGRPGATRFTDANGDAEVGAWILGPQAGKHEIEVTVAGSSVTFKATAT